MNKAGITCFTVLFLALLFINEVLAENAGIESKVVPETSENIKNIVNIGTGKKEGKIESISKKVDNSKKSSGIKTIKREGLKGTPFFKVSTQIKNPLDLRDPFKKRPIRKKIVKNYGKGYMEKKKGYFSNIDEISNAPLSSIYVVGILTGKTRRALIRIGNDPKSLSQETYILKEGMKLGEDEAELKAILPGGIVLAQKIKNIYDQDEYLETIIPLISD